MVDTLNSNILEIFAYSYFSSFFIICKSSSHNFNGDIWRWVFDSVAVSGYGVKWHVGILSKFFVRKNLLLKL